MNLNEFKNKYNIETPCKCLDWYKHLKNCDICANKIYSNPCIMNGRQSSCYKDTYYYDNTGTYEFVDCKKEAKEELIKIFKKLIFNINKNITFFEYDKLYETCIYEEEKQTIEDYYSDEYSFFYYIDLFKLMEGLSL